ASDQPLNLAVTELRKSVPGLTQQKAAKDLKISLSFYASLEAGSKNFPLDVLHRILEYYVKTYYFPRSSLRKLFKLQLPEEFLNKAQNKDLAQILKGLRERTGMSQPQVAKKVK